MSLDQQDKEWMVSEVLKPVLSEMGIRFGEVNARLDRMDATIAEFLKAFLAERQSVSLRETDLEQRQNVLGERQAVLDRRLTEIEKKLLIQPPEGSK